MPSVLTDVPLGLDLEFPGYAPSRVNFDGLPCGRLLRELARVLLERTNTGGTIKSPATAEPYARSIRHLVRQLGSQGFDGPAAELTEELIFDYWRRCSSQHEHNTRVLLSQMEERWPGSLQPGVVAQLGGARLHPSPMSRPRPPMSAGETARLIAACRSSVEAAETRMAEAEVLVAAGANPGPQDWREEANLAWLFDHHGPQSTVDASRLIGVERWRIDRDVPGVLVRVREALFPTMDAALGFRMLLGLETGICPEGIDMLRADCIEWVGPTDARIRWVKARASGDQAHVFASRGPWSAGRLIERWLALSARARRFAPDPVRLWLISAVARLRPYPTGFEKTSREAFVARHGLVDDQGRPMRLNFPALRATYFARHDRHWNGAVRIDPNHSRRVEGDHYLTQTRASEPLEATIEAAQRDALRKAASAPLTVLDADELGSLADDPAAAAARLGMREGAAGELLSGQRDVFAASCRDFYNSPHGAAGSPCPSPVWTCLFCPLAVFTPTKVPNLLRLRDHLDRQWKALPAREWIHAYGAAQVRLERDILPRFPQAVIDAAMAEVEGDDEAIFYLRPEEHPWSG